ncbi:MAG: glycosyltransferase family 39 protein [Candidatus Kapaibacterium sp.]|nr:glycosyltransferase family 39 protein [Bacteroidota bacterium]
MSTTAISGDDTVEQITLQTQVMLLTGIVMLLAFIMVFPITHDHSIFQRGGEAILHGGVLYRDYIDIKPPLIYYVFAGIDWVFGYNEIGMRIFDFIYQLLTTSLLLYTVRIFTGNARLSYWVGYTYVLLYVSFNNSSLQCETLAVLPMVLAALFSYFGKDKVIFYVASGVAAGIAVGLKYTLGLFIVALLIDILVQPKGGKKIQSLVLLGIGFTLGVIIGLFPFINSDIRVGYSSVLEYTRYYISLGVPVLSAEFGKMLIALTTQHAVNNFSMLLLVSSSVSVYLFISQKEQHTSIQSILWLSIISVAVLYISIVVEKKFAIYHFYRIAGFYSILAGIGGYYGYYYILRVIRTMQRKQYVVLLFVAGAILIFSPLPRTLNIMYNAYCALNNTTAYNNAYHSFNPEFESRTTSLNVAEVIKKRTTKEDKIHVSTLGSSYIYHLIGEKTPTAFGNTQFYVAEGIPYSWKVKFVKELQSCTYLVVQDNDISNVNGHGQTSLQRLNAESLYSTELNKFTRDTVVEHFVFLRRIEPFTKTVQ